MAEHLLILICAISLYAQSVLCKAVTSGSGLVTSGLGIISTASNQPVHNHVYPPLTVTGQFPCLTANSYMILTDSARSSATYPIWTCTANCGGLSSGVGIMVFPATTTTGAYEVQNPPSGYPALGVSDLSVSTDAAFSTITSYDIDPPLPTTTSIFTYPAFPGLTLTVATTTGIPAVEATPISVPTDCKGGTGRGTGTSSAGSSASSVARASVTPAGPISSSASISKGPTLPTTSSQSVLSSASTDSSTHIHSSGSSAAHSRSGGSNSATISTTPLVASSASVSGGSSNIASASAVQPTTSGSAAGPGVPNSSSASGSNSAISVSSGESGRPNSLTTSSGASAISAQGSLSHSHTAAGQSTTVNVASSNQPGVSSGLPSGSSSGRPSRASDSASISASASVSQILPPGASIVTSIVAGTGGSASASTVVETFIPTIISSLTTLTTPLITSTVVTLGTSSASTIPITVFPGGTAWQIPSVSPGIPILSPPTAAPTVGTASGNPTSSGSNTISGHSASSHLSGFTTVTSSNPANSNTASPGSSAGYLGPVPISAEPATLTAALISASSANVVGLTTFTGTTTPASDQYTSGVSSNGHTKATGGAAPFPIFWSHTCWFCPPGLCLFCGVSLHLPPGIYPPGTIAPPPGWTGPLPTIEIGQDGTPYYPEEEPNDQEPSDRPSSAQQSSNSPSQTSKPSSQTSRASTSSQTSASSQTSGGFQCAQTGCAVCVDNDPPSAYQSPPSKMKRSRLAEREVVPYDGNLSPPAKNPDVVPQARSYAKELMKRVLPEPSDPPWNGNQDAYLWTQYSDANVVAGWVPLRQDAQFPSSALAYGLGANRFDVAVQGLYGCTSLMIISTAGVWMSHLWEDPSFAVNGVVNQANFQAQVLDRLGPGDGTAGFPGLNQYLNSEFAADTKPVAIIMTPRNRANPQPGVLMFQDQITQLSEKVQTIFGGTRTSSGQFTGGTLNGVPIVIDYTPKSDQFSQTWTSSGKALFQYDPVQIRCNGVQWAMVRLWVEDRVLYSYKHYWIARANQVVAPPANPRRAIQEKRQDQSAGDTPAPSCLASMTASGSVSLGSMTKSGPLSAASAVSGSGGNSASGLSSSPASVTATTTAATGNTATSVDSAALASQSRASVAAVSAAEITMSPLCTPYELNGGGDGGVENCNPAVYCQCSTGSQMGNYITMSGNNICGYTTMPSSQSQWVPSDQICTKGLSASSLRPTPTTTGKYIFTETDLPISGSGTTVYGCTSTRTSQAGPVMGTYCAGSKTPLTTLFPPIKTPTGAPAAPSCNAPANPQDASAQGDPDGYVPDPVFFEAAIGVFCGPECKGQSGCLAATGWTLASNMNAYKATFFCSDARDKPGGNKTLDCEPNDWENNPPPYWEASGILLNLGVKLIDNSCQWTVDSDTCNKWLSNTLTGCPAAGIDWNECIAWTVGAGAAELTLSDWQNDHPKNTW